MQAINLAEKLAGFSGSSEWFEAAFGRVVYTDGVHYLAETAGAFWLIDAIASHQSAKLNRACGGFQAWNLAKQPDGSWLPTCRADSDAPVLVSQSIEWCVALDPSGKSEYQAVPDAPVGTLNLSIPPLRLDGRGGVL